jgi:hypothetical protein
VTIAVLPESSPLAIYPLLRFYVVLNVNFADLRGVVQ